MKRPVQKEEVVNWWERGVRLMGGHDTGEEYEELDYCG